MEMTLEELKRRLIMALTTYPPRQPMTGSSLGQWLNWNFAPNELVPLRELEERQGPAAGDRFIEEVFTAAGLPVPEIYPPPSSSTENGG